MVHPFITEVQVDQKIRDALGGGVNVKIFNLDVKKKIDNTNVNIIEHLDYCEGWVNSILFVKGLWKGLDNPTSSELQNKDKWSEFIEIE